MKFIEDVAGIRVDSKWCDRFYVHPAKTKEEALAAFAEYLDEGLDEIIRNIKADYLNSQLEHRSFGMLELTKRNHALAEKLEKLEMHSSFLGDELRIKDAHIRRLEKRIEELGGKT